MGRWSFEYSDYAPAREREREALCALGNGYLVTRGTAPEAGLDAYHQPGTYCAGLYDRPVASGGGIDRVASETLVNLPNWLPIRFRVSDGPWFSLDAVKVLDFAQRLCLRTGLLARRVVFADDAGRVTDLRQTRLVHIVHVHLAALRTELRPLNWDGELEIRAGLDAGVRNVGSAIVPERDGRYCQRLREWAPSPEQLAVHVRTRRTRTEVALCARSRCWVGDDALDTVALPPNGLGLIEHRFDVPARAGLCLRLDKVVALYTSRDEAISECVDAALAATRQAPDFEHLEDSHAQGWRGLWNVCDLKLEDHAEETGIARMHVFHALQSASPHTSARDVGIPARGWHGEAYRGQVFWDELFVLPFFSLRFPVIARQALMYRYRRLDAARERAREVGLEGAAFPWRSGSDGREETPRVRQNPIDGGLHVDATRLQCHVGAAIVYDLCRYVEMTGDREFLSWHGAELVLEVARFYSSRSCLERDGRYHIRGVMGPDEFQTRYPGHTNFGIDDNAYTNVMAVFAIRRALGLRAQLSQARWTALCRRLNLDDGTLARFEDVSRRMFVPFLEGGILSQFAGYEHLQELDWDAVLERHGGVSRLDHVLEAEGDSPNRYKASKQADVLMLFYLFRLPELQELLHRLGYHIDGEAIRRTVRYYLDRTTHGSTLSGVVHAWVGARSGTADAWTQLQRALRSDVGCDKHDSTAEGIHLAAMVGTLDLLQRCYVGIAPHDGVLWFDPHPPPELGPVSMRIIFESVPLCVAMDARGVRVSADAHAPSAVAVGHAGRVENLPPGGEVRFAFESGEPKNDGAELAGSCKREPKR